MHFVLESLMNGCDLLLFFEKAQQHWSEVLSGINELDSEKIATIASREQQWFMRNCGENSLGQEVMVITGIMRHYSTSNGFGDELQKTKAMVQALRTSFCSQELKAITEEVASTFPSLRDCLND